MEYKSGKGFIMLNKLTAITMLLCVVTGLLIGALIFLGGLIEAILHILLGPL